MTEARIELYVDEDDGTITSVSKALRGDTILSKDLLLAFAISLHGAGFRLPDDLEDRISKWAE